MLYVCQNWRIIATMHCTMKMTRGLFLDIRPTCKLDITFSLFSLTVCSVTCKI